MRPFVPKLILVPTDFSEPAAHALRYASGLAERFGAHLLVLHADPFTPLINPTGMTAGAIELSRDALVERAREALQTHAEENIDETVPFDLRVVVGGTLEAIAAQVRETGANLVVMGTHGRTGVSRLILGSVTECIIRTLPVPVIAVHSGVQAPARIRKVLCAVGLNDSSRAALHCASALARPDASPLLLVRAIGRDPDHTAMRELSLMRKWVPEPLADSCELRLTTAEHADEIVGLATDHGADLIALGIEPGRTVYETLRGTFAEQVVQQSRCAVLTVNARAPLRSRVAFSFLPLLPSLRREGAEGG